MKLSEALKQAREKYWNSPPIYELYPDLPLYISIISVISSVIATIIVLISQ